MCAECTNAGLVDDGVNVPLLRKALEWAENEARIDALTPGAGQWDQRYWAYRPVGELADDKCDTTYCLAGWIVTANEFRPIWDESWQWAADRCVSPNGNIESIPDVAARLLNITTEQADRLFNYQLDTIDNLRKVAEDIAGERL